MLSGSLISIDDLIKRFGEREIQRLSKNNSDTVQAAIDDATAEAKSYLSAARFDKLPEKPPVVLQIKVCDIARWYLYENGVTEIVEKRYHAAINWLKQVQKNPSMLGFELGDDVQEANNARFVVIPNVLEDWKDAEDGKF